MNAQWAETAAKWSEDAARWSIDAGEWSAGNAQGIADALAQEPEPTATCECAPRPSSRTAPGKHSASVSSPPPLSPPTWYEGTVAYFASMSPEGLGMLLGAIACVVALLILIGTCVYRSRQGDSPRTASSRSSRRRRGGSSGSRRSAELDGDDDDDDEDDIEGSRRKASKRSSERTRKHETSSSSSSSKSRSTKPAQPATRKPSRSMSRSGGAGYAPVRTS